MKCKMKILKSLLLLFPLLLITGCNESQTETKEEPPHRYYETHFYCDAEESERCFWYHCWTKEVMKSCVNACNVEVYSYNNHTHYIVTKERWE